MKTDSFSYEKHLPVRRFIADESKVATGLYGPRAIADDIDNIHAMFDPEAEILDGTERGGIGEKNLQDGAVSLKKLHPELKEKIAGAISDKQLNIFLEEYEQKLERKAEKSDSLAGYGIKNAYTKGETDTFFQNIHSELNEKASSAILYEDIVNTPLWTKQPTFNGVLDASLMESAYYYVTLQDESGNVLPSGQFMLKNSYTADATVYSTVFFLENLDTGTDILTENYPVEIASAGIKFGMRDAGVVLLEASIQKWNLNEKTGSLQTILHGEIIPKHTNLYCYYSFKTDSNVESYHSTNGTTAFQNSATRDIVAYASMPELQYDSTRIFDSCSLQRDGNSRFSMVRECAVRYQENKAKSYQVLGYGKTFSIDTNVEKVIFRLNNNNNGVIRNGSVIRILEVK